MITLAFFVGVQLNVLLAIFNLLPIAPLDGSHVLLDLLDRQTAQRVRDFMNQYGIMLLVLVVFFAGRIIWPIMKPILNVLYGIDFYQ
jgi:Zn-dependent protease